ncbi:type II toxin-antitoxin system Phd/YefM family antitoxin [Fortiea sp. LEGE XX443]|uniref:type II toxin-antitoxin system Phd/YefM family antitoxin n=1 Tax=Fortiea sp. LEGE XX443 TaxID=1828611 RepID=UPI0018829041|nr:type II toxin-antitoxin system Phd/YefM family antitoxin [Fortiea sp. LEGE XX443]MBE9008128.1 type II toxin-antitoxin system Phd/YefM family antitoxin [Fortiea sp. LEGE XX443]
MTQITLSDFPETIQTLLNQAQKTGETLTITQNDIEIAVISPIKKKSLLEALSTLEPLDEDLGDVDEGLLPLDNIEF